MEELIRQKCEEYGITPDILTPREMSALKSEIAEEQQGKAILDSVLDDPKIHLRAITEG